MCSRNASLGLVSSARNLVYVFSDHSFLETKAQQVGKIGGIASEVPQEVVRNIKSQLHLSILYFCILTCRLNTS